MAVYNLRLPPTLFTTHVTDVDPATTKGRHSGAGCGRVGQSGTEDGVRWDRGWGRVG